MQAPSRENIWKMFDTISPTYDKANRYMTFGLDVLWRKKMTSFLPTQTISILDCATGTGDQIITFLDKCKNIEGIVGIDLAADMMAIAKKKTDIKPYASLVSYQVASALEIPFPDQSFDCVTISFGIRNVTDVLTALKEFYRVLKPHGRLLILEGTVPKNPLLRFGHLFYLRHVLPRIGGMISKNPSAYRYLNQTIETFPQGKAFCDLMEQAGFNAIKANPLTGGVATIYQGDRNIV